MLRQFLIRKTSIYDHFYPCLDHSDTYHLNLDKNTEHLPSSHFFRQNDPLLFDFGVENYENYVDCTCVWYKIPNIGRKTFSPELVPLGTPLHVVERGLLGSGIMEGFQVGQRLQRTRI